MTGFFMKCNTMLKWVNNLRKKESKFQVLLQCLKNCYGGFIENLITISEIM